MVKTIPGHPGLCIGPLPRWSIGSAKSRYVSALPGISDPAEHTKPATVLAELVAELPNPAAVLAELVAETSQSESKLPNRDFVAVVDFLAPYLRF